MMIQGILKANANKLNLNLTLKTGQNFRWKKPENDNEWLGILKNIYVVSLIQCNQEIVYKLLNTDYVLNFYKISPTDQKSMKKFQLNFDHLLQHYFSFDIDLEELYESWAKTDENFGRICSKFKGIRLLRQDIVENIFSFICSSNNNISRISKMVETLCNQYGTKLYNNIYSFPSISVLASDQVEQSLRKFGFGYRAKFINQTAKRIMKESQGKPDEWIDKLTKLSYNDARQELLSLPGIGAKVADCICLMSLGFTEAIPVDTHVYQLTAKLYMPNLKSKSLTTKRYNEIGNFYREKFKLYPGWAQTILFCSDLKMNN